MFALWSDENITARGPLAGLAFASRGRFAVTLLAKEVSGAGDRCLWRYRSSVSLFGQSVDTSNFSYGSGHGRLAVKRRSFPVLAAGDVWFWRALRDS